jgi:hypothetical protein
MALPENLWARVDITQTAVPVSIPTSPPPKSILRRRQERLEMHKETKQNRKK